MVSDETWNDFHDMCIMVTSEKHDFHGVKSTIFKRGISYTKVSFIIRTFKSMSSEKTWLWKVIIRFSGNEIHDERGVQE